MLCDSQSEEPSTEYGRRPPESLGDRALESSGRGETVPSDPASSIVGCKLSRL